MEKRGVGKEIGESGWCYAEDFKIKIVKEIESGLFSKESARRKYGIRIILV